MLTQVPFEIYEDKIKCQLECGELPFVSNSQRFHATLFSITGNEYELYFSEFIIWFILFTNINIWFLKKQKMERMEGIEPPLTTGWWPCYRNTSIRKQ